MNFITSIPAFPVPGAHAEHDSPAGRAAFSAWSADEVRVAQLLMSAGMLPTLRRREATIPTAAAG